VIPHFIARWWADRNTGRPTGRVNPSQFKEKVAPDLLAKWLQDEVDFWTDAAAHTDRPNNKRQWLEYAQFYRIELENHREEQHD
jgi:hypothetical protein